jgi:hypothetical protein
MRPIIILEGEILETYSGGALNLPNLDPIDCPLPDLQISHSEN